MLINRKANLGPFLYPSDRNDPFDSKNKTVRQIFDWVKIEGVIITLRQVWISPMGAYYNYQVRKVIT